MKPIFEAAWHFFKMYFLPLPPHDSLEPEEEAATPDNGPRHSAPLPHNPTSEPPAPAAIPAAASADSVLAQEEPATSSPSAVEETKPTSDKPDANTAGPDFSHLVKPPEGAEERLSRGTTFRLAPAAALEEAPEIKPEEPAAETAETEASYPAERDEPAPPAAGASDDYDVLPEDDPNITPRPQPPDDDDAMNNRGVNPFSD